MVPSIAYARAHHLAKRAVERELAAQGRRAPFAEIIALAQAYRAAHQEELLAQAAEAVRTSPWHSMMADREVRELEREQADTSGHRRQPAGADLSLNQVGAKGALKRLNFSVQLLRFLALAAY